MINVYVVRKGIPTDKLKDGTPIIDQNLLDDNMAVLRGAAELNLEEPTYKVTIQIPFRAGLECGQIVEVMDDLRAETWRGMIESITHHIQVASAYTDLIISRSWREYPMSID